MIGLTALAVTGYFIGLTAPSKPTEVPSSESPEPYSTQQNNSSIGEVIPALSHADMAAFKFGPNRNWTTKLSMLKETEYDLFAKIEIDPGQKLDSLAEREQLRAFNGAPPTVPHPVDQMSSQSCMPCHKEGLRSATLRASKMPHPYYTNCTQCHVEAQSRDFYTVDFRKNSFKGLPAPSFGPRAFSAAPPVVPHSTWMRNDCSSCHGRTAAAGLQTTHPWRRNCVQCHGVSAELNQARAETNAPFLPPPKVIDSNNASSQE